MTKPRVSRGELQVCSDAVRSQDFSTGYGYAGSGKVNGCGPDAAGYGTGAGFGVYYSNFTRGASLGWVQPYV